MRSDDEIRADLAVVQSPPMEHLREVAEASAFRLAGDVPALLAEVSLLRSERATWEAARLATSNARLLAGVGFPPNPPKDAAK